MEDGGKGREAQETGSHTGANNLNLLKHFVIKGPFIFFQSFYGSQFFMAEIVGVDEEAHLLFTLDIMK